MLKKNIKYTDFDGNEISEDFYFNLTKAELIEMELSEKDGFAEHLQQIAESNDGKVIISKFKEIILKAYGVRSEDGKRFIKNEQLAEEFSQTAAYSELFTELATDAEASAVFINGLVPAGLAQEVAKAANVQAAGEHIASELQRTRPQPQDHLQKQGPQQMGIPRPPHEMGITSQQSVEGDYRPDPRPQSINDPRVERYYSGE